MRGFAFSTGLVFVAWGIASGQGTVTSQNSSSSLITNWLTMAPVPAGTTFKVALYYLPDTGVTPSVFGGILAPDPGWIMLGPAVNIAPTAGRYFIGTRTTPNTTPPGGLAWFQVRVWETAFGGTFEEAWQAPPIGGRRTFAAVSDVMHVTTGSPPGLPGAANPIGFIPIVPEPSALGLMLLGGGVCWLLGWPRHPRQTHEHSRCSFWVGRRRR